MADIQLNFQRNPLSLESPTRATSSEKGHPMKNNMSKILLLGVLAIAIGSFFFFDLGQYLSFEYLKSQQAAFQNYYNQNPALTIAIYFVVYVLVTALSLPGATVMTLAGGMMFGVLVGTITVSFASTLGATLAFLVARFMLRDYVQAKFGEKIKAINQGVEREGAFYLFTLRLIPAFPFFVINLVMGLTPIRTLQYFVVSQIGMLPGTIVYVNAGTQLGKLDSLKGILSPSLLLSFALLGVFPLVVKKVMAQVQKRRSV
ncbi:MAG: TVP38/TMEM64 family protein [Bdellovibrionales bacterium]|nr:TVP38/TMEM64 family protein [Bdellovibrionales bacterium]